MLHAVITLIIQIIVGLVFNNWWFGGLCATLFYISREHTQAEYRWIATFGNGKRANMPWWGGFDTRAWNVKSVLDWAAPLATSLGVYFLMDKYL
jgi:hypothetical protein